MVMVTRSARRKACFDNSDTGAYNVPPWCSLGKVNKRSKPNDLSAGDWDRNCLLEHDWGISTRNSMYRRSACKSGYCRKNKTTLPKSKSEKQDSKFPAILPSLLLLIALLIALELFELWRSGSGNKPEQISTDVSNIADMIQATSNDGSCCSRLNQLTAELWRAEQTLRKTRAQKKLMLSQKSELFKLSTSPEVALTSSAAASVGGNTRQWSGRTALWGIVPLWRAAPSPDTVLAARPVTTADCWPFSGSNGEVIISLQSPARLRRISIEHVRPDTARSAPKQFTLYNLLDNGTRTKTASGEYNYNGPAKQYFAIPQAPRLKRVSFTVLSNHGNNRYTCIYRINLYGYE